ncbi:hypothetical protein ACFFKU_15415 [Kineococcus gynurae]|uniref:Uncharacterized protein n=1 Tax=Kineococcus gynurae TaxID=452979 RepID=A0ABV5LTB0_9ACTN
MSDVTGPTTGPRRRGHLRSVAEGGPSVPDLLETDALLDRLGSHESTDADLQDPVGRLLHGFALFSDPFTAGARPVVVELPAAEADEAAPVEVPAPRVLVARRSALQTFGRGTAAACAIVGLFAGTAAAASTSTDALGTLTQRVSASADAARPSVPAPILEFFAGSPEERVIKVVQRAKVSASVGNVAGAQAQVAAVAEQLDAASRDPGLIQGGLLGEDPTALGLLLETVNAAATDLAVSGEISEETAAGLEVLPTAAPAPAQTPQTLTDVIIAGITQSATPGPYAPLSPTASPSAPFTPRPSSPVATPTGEPAPEPTAPVATTPDGTPVSPAPTGGVGTPTTEPPPTTTPPTTDPTDPPTTTPDPTEPPTTTPDPTDPPTATPEPTRPETPVESLPPELPTPGETPVETPAQEEVPPPAPEVPPTGVALPPLPTPEPVPVVEPGDVVVPLPDVDPTPLPVEVTAPVDPVVPTPVDGDLGVEVPLPDPVVTPLPGSVGLV